MNKNIVYSVIALCIGLLGGYLFFGENQKNKAEETVETHNAIADNAAPLWTCAMHPQIMQPEPGKCPICGMTLIPRRYRC